MEIGRGARFGLVQYEFAIIKVSQQDGKTTATVVDERTRMLGETHVKRVECNDGGLTITLTTGLFGETQFRGKLSRDSASGQGPGNMPFQ